MKTSVTWFLILALFGGMPALALAQDAGTTETGTTQESTQSETGSTDGTSGDPAGTPGTKPKPPMMGRPSGQNTQGQKSLNGLPPGTPVKNMMEKRMENGSSGPKLPPGIKEGVKDRMIEKRMENGSSGPKIPPGMIKDRMMPNASGTGKMMDRMKLLKDGKMDRKMDAAKEFIRGAIERMDNAVERLKKLSTRIDQMILKMKEKGVDTSNAESLLGVAKTKIAEAESAVDNAKLAIEAAKPTTTGETPGQISDETRQAVKTALEAAKTAVQAAHKALIDAVNAVKATGGVGSDSSSNPGSGTN